MLCGKPNVPVINQPPLMHNDDTHRRLVVISYRRRHRLYDAPAFVTDGIRLHQHHHHHFLWY